VKIKDVIVDFLEFLFCFLHHSILYYDAVFMVSSKLTCNMQQEKTCPFVGNKWILAEKNGYDPGIVAAIDGSVDRKAETMGAGFVVGTGPQPEDSLSFPVGGPLASLRGEASGLDCLLDRVEPGEPLLVFTDCLVLLTILLRWGRIDFGPDPDDVRHFDIINSCLHKLRRRTGPTCLVKVKSHSGLLMNDRADALAEQGRLSEEPPRWPGSRKLEPPQRGAAAMARCPGSLSAKEPGNFTPRSQTVMCRTSD
jgi:ribonuclease HI